MKQSSDGELSSIAKSKQRAGKSTKDDEYYIESSFVVFKVENGLFRVPGYLLVQESGTFGNMFTLPDDQGSTTTNPIDLQHYKQSDFRNLMKALYPKSVSLQLTLSKEEWVSILRISCPLFLLRLREMAISELERYCQLSPSDKITLGRECGIPSWLTQGYEELVGQESITDHEARIVEYLPTLRIFRIREQKLRRTIGNIRAEVEKVFEEEIEIVRGREQAFQDEY